MDQISPRQHDEIRLKSLSSETGLAYSKDIHLRQESTKRPMSKIHINVREQRSEGVFDLIGGETWEAAFILSAFILKNPMLFIRKTCLELGSGVGLPSLLLIALKLRDLDGLGSVILTDYEELLLENLYSSLTSQFEECSMIDGGLNVRIESLDWLSKDDTLPALGSTDIVMGSALVYQPDHAVAAHIIRRYLEAGCSEALVIQMSSRPGFDLFYRNLQDLGLSVVVSSVPDDVYTLAQKISILPGTSSEERSTVRVTAAGGVSRVTSSTIVTRRFYEFPAEVFKDVNRSLNLCAKSSVEVPPEELSLNSPPVVWKWGGMGPSGIGGKRNNLIKTDIEAFVIMRISLSPSIPACINNEFSS